VAIKKPTSNTITIPRLEARWFVDAAMSSISSDEVTPVLCAAKITVTGDAAEILSTDRYRVTLARATVKASADHSFLIPREALLWLKKNQGAFGSYNAQFQTVTFETREDGRLTVAINDGAEIDVRGSLTWNGLATKGNFPPVEKLFVGARESASVAGARVNLDFIAKAKILGSRYEAPTLKFTTGSNPDKPGPLLLTFEKGDRGNREITAEVLIQPNLELR
jgi:hypothetical protein